MSMFRFFRRTDQVPTPTLEELALYVNEFGVLTQKVGPHGAETPVALDANTAAALAAADSPSASNPFTTGIKTVTGSLSSAQILALFSAPVELAPAAAGKLYWPIQALLIFHPGVTPYLAGSQALVIGPAAPLSSALALVSASFLQETTFDLTLLLQAALNQSPLYNTDCVGAPLFLTVDGENPTLGDGTLDYVVLYREVLV